MSLDISKLQHVRSNGAKTTALCPACAEAGHDQTQNHLIIRTDGRFGCVVYPGDSPDVMEHRKRIFALCGKREIKQLVVRCRDLGRLGRVDQSHSACEPLKTGLLGRVGRLFQTHLEGEQQSKGNEKHPTDHQLKDCRKGVLGVLRYPKTTPHRPLTERERALLMRWCGTDTDPLISDAINLFNATIAGIERSR